MTSKSITFHYRELTRDAGLWVSTLHECQDGEYGEQLMRQGVIGGFSSCPRCAVSSAGFFYGLGSDGKELDRVKAFELGLIEEWHLNKGELFNERLITEVRFCGYAQYEAAIKACDVKLSSRLGKIEADVLTKMKPWHEQTMPDVSRALLFGSAFRGLSKSELAAVVKLARRGLIKFYRSFGGSDGYVLRFSLQEGA